MRTLKFQKTKTYEQKIMDINRSGGQGSQRAVVPKSKQVYGLQQISIEEELLDWKKSRQKRAVEK